MDSFRLPIHKFCGRASSALDLTIRSVFKRQAMSMTPIYADLAAQLPAIFAKERINLVLGTDSGSVAGRCLFRTAERMAIHTAFVQHGAFVQVPSVAHYFTNARLLLWGASSRDTLLRSGVSQPERITSIGSAFEEETLKATAKQSNASAVTNQTSMVLVTFGVPGNLVGEGPFLKAATEVIHAAEQLPHIQFVIKPHPGDKTNLWEKNAREQTLQNVTIRRDADTYALMRSCRVLVTMLSTTGAEAIYLGKPVISVNLDHLPTGLDYIAFGAAYRIDQPRTLSALLRSLIEGPRDADPLAEVRRDFAKHFLYREERPAAERIVNYLECLTSGSSLANLPCGKS
jgi:Capsule polysaccharide biosynthesis protein